MHSTSYCVQHCMCCCMPLVETPTLEWLSCASPHETLFAQVKRKDAWERVIFETSIYKFTNYYYCVHFRFCQYFKYLSLTQIPKDLCFQLNVWMLSFTLFVRYCMFNQYRIPKSYLLSKIGSVNEEGQYVSPIKDPRKRFGLFFFSQCMLYVLSVERNIECLCVNCFIEGFQGVFLQYSKLL